MSTRRTPSIVPVRRAVVRPSLALFEAKQQLLMIQAEEEALTSLLKTPVIEITLRTGPEQMTIAVNQATSRALVNDLLLDATQRRQQAEQCWQQLTQPTSVPIDAPQPRA